MPAECCIATQLGTFALAFLRVDIRPTFIVSVPNNISTGKTVVLFVNDALRDVEERGELSMEWVLNEGLLKYGGGCFPTSRWRFTAVVVEDDAVKGKVMVVTATSISTLEWNVGVWADQFNGSERSSQTIAVDEIEREEAEDQATQFLPVGQNKCKSSTTEAKSALEEARPSPDQLTPSILSIILQKELEMEGEKNRGGTKPESETIPREQPYSRAKSPIQTFAAANSKPSFTVLRPQQSGPFMDWMRGSSPLQTSEHYRNLKNVDWYIFRCPLSTPYYTY